MKMLNGSKTRNEAKRILRQRWSPLTPGFRTVTYTWSGVEFVHEERSVYGEVQLYGAFPMA